MDRRLLTIMNHAQAECRQYRQSHTFLLSFSLSGGSHPFLIGSSCVRIYDLYFTWHSGAQEVEEFAVLGVHDGSLDELHHRVAAVLKLRVTPQAERPWRRREVFVFIYISHAAFYHL